MQSEWTGYFEYICSMHNIEIAELLENSDYKTLSDKLKKAESDAERAELAEKKAACYYKQAAVVALKHFVTLMRETNMI